MIRLFSRRLNLTRMQFAGATKSTQFEDTVRFIRFLCFRVDASKSIIIALPDVPIFFSYSASENE